MSPSEIESLMYRIDGYVDALASTTEGFRAWANCVHLDTDRMDDSIATYFEDNHRDLKKNFPGLEVAPYHFEKAEALGSWIRHLQDELEKCLLPRPLQELFPDKSALKKIKYDLAWQVMEMVRMITDDFQSKVIYKIQFRKPVDVDGVIFVIPLENTCLIMAFES